MTKKRKHNGDKWLVELCHVYDDLCVVLEKLLDPKEDRGPYIIRGRGISANTVDHLWRIIQAEEEPSEAMLQAYRELRAEYEGALSSYRPPLYIPDPTRERLDEFREKIAALESVAEEER